MQRKIFSFLLAFAAVLLLGSTASAQQKFTAAMNPLQENPPTNSNGRGNCVITLNFAQTQITDVTCSFSQLTSGVTQGHIHGPAAPGANAGILFDLTPPTGVTSAGPFTRGPFTLTADQLTLLRTKRLYVNIHTSNFPGGEIRGQIKIQTTPYDNDGDGRTDIRAYRPSTSTYHVLNSINNSIFNSTLGLGFPSASTIILGSASDDYDGDGRGDLVLLRGSSSPYFWRILQTGSNTIREVTWGIQGTDDLVPADYDGDGKTDIAVYRYLNGVWYILQSSTNNQIRAEFWGQPGNFNEFGYVGDFDRDGRSDLTTIRPEFNTNVWRWYTRRSSDNAIRIVDWGSLSTDFFFTSAQIDIDADGIQDRMVYRDPNPATETADNPGDQLTFLILRSSDNGHFILPFGKDTDSFRFGDYDGDGRTDIVARRVIGGQLIWFIYQSSNAQVRVVNWGITGDSLAGEDESESDFETLPTLKRGR